MNGPNDPAEGAFHYGSLVVDLALVVLVGWAVWWVVRYLRADAMTRQSIRQAVRVRWGWKRLAPMTRRPRASCAASGTWACRSRRSRAITTSSAMDA